LNRAEMVLTAQREKRMKTKCADALELGVGMPTSGETCPGRKGLKSLQVGFREERETGRAANCAVSGELSTRAQLSRSLAIQELKKERSQS